MKEKIKTKYDYMKEADNIEEDADFPIDTPKKQTKKEEYFDYYDDIKISIKEDW